MRVGVVYIGNWGWIEGDLVVDFRLQSAKFLFTNRTVANGRIEEKIMFESFAVDGSGVEPEVVQEPLQLLDEIQGDGSELSEMAQEASVVRLVNEILLEAIESRRGHHQRHQGCIHGERS